MPRSKKRRRRVAEQQKNLDRARKLIHREEQRAVIRTPTPTLCRSTPDLNLKEAKNNQSSNAEEESTNEVGGWLDFGGLYTGILQSMEIAKDIVFPSRVLKKELDDAKKRLQNMEDELSELRKLENMTNIEQASSTSCPVPAIAPPPPPPPPPPPVVVPQPRIIMTRKKTKILKKETVTKQPVITLDSIRSVKLRKVKDENEPSYKKARRNSSDGCARFSSDLKATKLSKRRQSFQPTSRTVNLEFSNLRKTLHPVGGARSPGGTLLRDSTMNCIKDTGEGATPMLARALKRKFKAAYPLSPLTSPTSPLSPSNYATPCSTPFASRHKEQ